MDGDRILVLLRQKESVDIAFVSVDDGSVQKLKSFPSQIFSRDSRMSLSPDEQYIALSGIKQKDSQTNSDIHIISADGNTMMPLITHPADDVVLGWSPDGEHVLFKSDRTGGNSLWAVQVKNGKPDGDPKLIRPAIGDIRPLGLTPEGSLYFGLYSGWSDIFVSELDPETGEILSPPVMAVKKNQGSNSAPEWSSDGLYLACRSSGYISGVGKAMLLISNFRTGEIREVIPENISGLNFHFIRWSPDGRSILGVGFDEKGNYGALVSIETQTGKSKIIARENENGIVFQPDWAPDGQSVFFLRRWENRKIVNHDIDTGEEKGIYDTPHHILYMTLSPDGKLLAFFAEETVKILSTSGGEPRKLIQDKDINSLAWSADGRFLFYGKRRNAKTDIVEVWCIPVAGGEPQKLDLSMSNLMHLRVHPDGRKIAFTGSLQPATSEIWVMENFLTAIKDNK